MTRGVLLLPCRSLQTSSRSPRLASSRASHIELHRRSERCPSLTRRHWTRVHGHCATEAAAPSLEQPWPAARWSSGQRSWGRRHKTGRRGIRYGRQRQRTQAGQRRAAAARHGRRGSKPGEGLVAGGGCPPSGAHTATAPGPPRTCSCSRGMRRRDWWSTSISFSNSPLLLCSVGSHEFLVLPCGRWRLDEDGNSSVHLLLSTC